MEIFCKTVLSHDRVYDANYFGFLDTHVQNHYQNLISPVLQVENVHLSDLTSVTECCNNAFFISGSFPIKSSKFPNFKFHCRAKFKKTQEIIIRYYQAQLKC